MFHKEHLSENEIKSIIMANIRFCGYLNLKQNIYHHELCIFYVFVAFTCYYSLSVYVYMQPDRSLQSPPLFDSRSDSEFTLILTSYLLMTYIY